MCCVWSIIGEHSQKTTFLFYNWCDTMVKKKCSCNDNLKKLFQCLEKRSKGIVFYKLCFSELKIGSGGKIHVISHTISDKQKRATASDFKPTSKRFFTDNSNQKCSIDEGIIEFHTVRHNQSFRIINCTLSLWPSFLMCMDKMWSDYRKFLHTLDYRRTKIRFAESFFYNYTLWYIKLW